MASTNPFTDVNLDTSTHTYAEPPPSYADIQHGSPQPPYPTTNPSVPPRAFTTPSYENQPNFASNNSGVYPGSYNPQSPPLHQHQEQPRVTYIVRNTPVYIIPKAEVDRIRRRRKILICISLFFSIMSIIVALIIIFGTNDDSNNWLIDCKKTIIIIFIL